MNRLVLILLISFVSFSCGSRKKIVTKKEKTSEVGVVTVPEDDDKKIEPIVVSEKPVRPPNSTDAYIDMYKDIAIEEMRKSKIPASITLAQGILESGSGKGRLAVKANNHFGIKCHGWKGQKIYHDDDERQECFRKYRNAKYSFRDHSEFLTNRKRYANLFKLRKTDYKGWAKELRRAGYATDKKYPQKLISLIERYKLYQYDDYSSDRVIEHTSRHVVLKGETLYSISKKYNLTVNEIQKMNGLENTDLSIGQVLIVKPKKQ